MRKRRMATQSLPYCVQHGNTQSKNFKVPPVERRKVRTHQNHDRFCVQQDKRTIVVCVCDTLTHSPLLE